VYASAENLEGYYPGNDKGWLGAWLDDDSQAMNRHRKCFDESTKQDDPFFPHVHLGPINNGCLSTEVLYIASKVYDVGSVTPREFYESIAFGNYCKYSRESELQENIRNGRGAVGSKSNNDYADDDKLLGESHDFVRADIETLKPDIIIVPDTIYKYDREFISEIIGDIRVIPIYQINPRVINRHIAKKYPLYDIGLLHPTVQNWYDKLNKEGMNGKNKENYMYIFSYLDSILNNIGSNLER